MANSFPAFGFPPPPRVVPPSQARAELEGLANLNALVIGVAAVSVVLNILLAALLIKDADIIPFVADGGVAGCQVPVAVPANVGGPQS